MMEFDFLQFITDDKKIISYRPRWNSFTGGALASIFLQQCIYRYTQSGKRPFYKFTQPCKHGLYKPGDSWIEELGVKRKPFERARAMVSERVKPGETFVGKRPFIFYWMGNDHLTWYQLNEDVLGAYLAEVYQFEPVDKSMFSVDNSNAQNGQQALPNAQNGQQLMPKMGNSTNAQNGQQLQQRKDYYQRNGGGGGRSVVEAIYQHLKENGINDPKASMLAELDWVTVEYIDQTLQDAPSPQAAIYRMENQWVPAKPKKREIIPEHLKDIIKR